MGRRVKALLDTSVLIATDVPALDGELAIKLRLNRRAPLRCHGDR